MRGILGKNRLPLVCSYCGIRTGYRLYAKGDPTVCSIESPCDGIRSMDYARWDLLDEICSKDSADGILLVRRNYGICWMDII